MDANTMAGVQVVFIFYSTIVCIFEQLLRDR